MNGGNYSASDSYHQKTDSFRRKQIDPTKIRPRLFRNYYVLYQSQGYFVHNTWVYTANELKGTSYTGRFYGPFFKADAERFAADVKDTHESFILG